MNQMDRREFCKIATATGAALLAGARVNPAAGQDLIKPGNKIRGVNLGGWLVLEHWITPTLFNGVEAEDEYTFCEKLGKEKAAARLKKHRETWITADDFKWLAKCGINAVRLPVGYWILEENPPFITGQDTLEWVFRTAKVHGLRVLLDLHGVPGSQNGWDHSGRSGKLGWHTSKENIEHSLRIIEGLAQFCKNYDNLLGVELLNEPSAEVPLDILQSYYWRAYALVRKHLSAERAAVVFHDGFRPKAWGGFMPSPQWKNVFLDTHLYQCFNEDDQRRDLPAQLQFASTQRKQELDALRQHHRCIVGEWSCALPPNNLDRLHGSDLDAAMRAYATAQLASYDSTEGWFFWTYRTEGGGGWSFRACTENGWLPARYKN